jgi:general secretion pathway protein A
MITGEPGTGKTTLLNVFIKEWKQKAAIALILTPRLMPEEFLHSVLEDLEVRIEASTKNELIKAFRDFLINQSDAGRRVIIIVDEAQNLPVETLEELRLLSNLETSREKLLQIVLVGQPELEEKLSRSELRQLNQRITTRVRLGHFNLEETRDYLNYRLIKAGKTFLRFDDQAVKQIHRLSKGIPRLINILAQRALMAAYIDESNIVKKGHVRNAEKSISSSEELSSTGRPRGVVFTVLVIVAIVIAVSAVLYLRGIVPLTEKAVVANTRVKQSETLALVKEDANIRSAPDIKSERVGIVLKGQRVPVVGEFIDKKGNRWFKIRFFGNREAWISAELVSLKHEKE